MLVPLLFQLASVVMFWWLYDQIYSSRAKVAHSQEVIEAVDSLRISLNAGYYAAVLSVVVKNFEVERSETRSLGEVRAAVHRIEELTVDNPSQTVRVTAIKRSFEEFLILMKSLETAAVRAGADTAPPAAGTKTKEVIALFHESFRAKKALDDEVMSFRAVEVDLQHRRGDDLTAILRVAGWFVLAGFIVILCVSSLFFVLFRDAIARRLQLMTSNLRRIAGGEALPAALPGKDEIAQVDIAIHNLAAALAEKALDTEVFLYSVSHDLRSPLVNLSGFADELRFSAKQLREELETLRARGANIEPALKILDNDEAKSFAFIRVAISRLSRIIDALLRLSRAGRVKYKDEPVELAPVVARVVQSLRKSIDEKKADVRTLDLPVVYGDEAAFEQIFANLITNALMYLDPDRPGFIEVGTTGPSAEQGMVVVHIRDNGVGMSDGSKKKLFLAFQRFRPDAGPGEGIGLAITRRAVTALGGKIWCESTENFGTTFFVSLPTKAGMRIVMPEAMVGL